MSNKVRDTLGKFAPKSEAPRKIRSVNLTDDAWHWLATAAEKAGVSRNDYLEALASSKQPFMEMVESPSSPFIETVHTEIEAEGTNIAQQPNSELLPFIETVGTEVDSPRDEVEAVRAENQRLHIELGNSASEKELLKQELVELRAQLETESADREKTEEEVESLRQELTKNTRYYAGRLNEAGATIGIFKDKLATAQAKNQRLQNDLGNLQVQVAEVRAQLQTERIDREKTEAELSEKKQNSAPATTLSEKLTPDAAIILSQLRVRRKKFPVSLADIEAILEIMEES